MINRSSYVTRAGVAREQPVPFSHKRHVSGVGIDCRYCHNGGEKSWFSNIPTSGTCMNCHSAVLKDSPKLELVRQSYNTGKPIPWVQIHKTPDYVYFNHSVHVNRGVSCVHCHGPVNKMDEVDWSEARYRQIEAEFHAMAESFSFAETMAGTVEWDARPGARHPFRFDITAQADAISHGQPRRWSPVPIRLSGANLSYAIHPDGKRFAYVAISGAKPRASSPLATAVPRGTELR